MKVILCRLGFSNEYVETIRSKLPSSLHVTETFRNVESKRLAPDVLCILFGSPQSQKQRQVKIRFTHSTSSAFSVALCDLPGFFEKILTPRMASLISESAPLLA
jgi:hypothetical protein